MNDRADSKHIYTVSGLNREVGQLLAHGLPPWGANRGADVTA